ncbi:protein UL117 [Aotine betaherpesvirus 1]|uniref:Protein UL117 n=1 Tax=Aotine betaherpesvirus 1 TaxID=50290 RepID=G8XUH5_9BETA|nr:protein UL117 [Aotine betaherpesvirus 1]AEV80805.1 protein UL117 [Aotine betaherpesvirus 1]
MFSKVEIIRVREPIKLNSESLAPANKRKRNRAIVISPQTQGFVKIPPDNKNVNSVRIVGSRPARRPSPLQPPQPRHQQPRTYPYGTSLVRRRRIRPNGAQHLIQRYGHILEELARLLQMYDSTAVQLQVNSLCGNSFNQLKTAVLKLQNVTVLTGMQMATQCLPHDARAVSTFKHHERLGRFMDNVAPVLPRSSCYADTGLYQMCISGATRKDLVDATTLCISIIDQRPNVFNINIAKLSYPSLAGLHLGTYNEFSNTVVA